MIVKNANTKQNLCFLLLLIDLIMPQITKYPWIPDTFFNAMMAWGGIWLVLESKTPINTLKILKRMLIIGATVYALRGLLVIATILPEPCHFQIRVKYSVLHANYTYTNEKIRTSFF